MVDLTGVIEVVLDDGRDEPPCLGFPAPVGARDALQVGIAQGGDAGAELSMRRDEPAADSGHRRSVVARRAGAVSAGVVE